jgi:hypothetical protein
MLVDYDLTGKRGDVSFPNWLLHGELAGGKK